MQFAKQPLVRNRLFARGRLVCVCALVVAALARPSQARGASPSPLLTDPPIPPNQPPPDQAQALPIQPANQPAGLADGLTVDPKNRQQVVAFYTHHYEAESPAPAWTGDRSSCSAGDTSQEYKAAIIKRINFFRAMAGVPAAVTLSATYNSKAQKAALMMSVNGKLSHDPPSSWQCYTGEGKEGAGSGNLALGAHGPNAIDLYMLDPGAGNNFVGHRRWILYPQTQEMGTGDIPGGWGEGNYAANSLWVFDGRTWQARPATREEFVAWPPPGFVPYEVIFPRWSFSLAKADLSGASVAVLSDDGALPVKLEPTKNGFGENTLVWIPTAMNDNAPWPKPPAAGKTYTVTVSNVRLNNQTRSFTYAVSAIDPTISPSNTAPSGIALNGPGMIGSTWPANAPVAVFVPNDPDGAEGYTYALASGPGDGDNDAFVIQQNTLRTRRALTDVGKTYSVRVQATDPGGVSVSDVFTLPVVKTQDEFLPMVVK